MYFCCSAQKPALRAFQIFSGPFTWVYPIAESGCYRLDAYNADATCGFDEKRVRGERCALGCWGAQFERGTSCSECDLQSALNDMYE